MQIACKRFGCQKAVEVCYWTCKHRKNCKDWANALDGQPGRVAITERLETAAAKTGRVFEANTLVKPVRMKRAAAAPALLAPVTKTSVEKAPAAKAEAKPARLVRAQARPKVAPATVSKVVAQAVAQPVTAVAKVAPEAVTKPVTNGTHHKQRPAKLAVKPAQPERRVMPKPDDEKIEATTAVTAPKANGAKPAAKPAKPKPLANGTVYLLLSKNGKYKELREADLLKEAAHILKDPSLRLVKGQYLVPQITFKALDD